MSALVLLGKTGKQLVAVDATLGFRRAVLVFDLHDKQLVAVDATALVFPGTKEELVGARC